MERSRSRQMFALTNERRWLSSIYNTLLFVPYLGFSSCQLFRSSFSCFWLSVTLLWPDWGEVL
jgi:hypothetical protein